MITVELNCSVCDEIILVPYFEKFGEEIQCNKCKTVYIIDCDRCGDDINDEYMILEKKG